MTEKAYLICCSNGDDTSIVLVNEATWTWFQTRSAEDENDEPSMPPEDQITETMTRNDVDREEAIEFLLCSPTSSTFDNDIALMLSDDAFNGEKLPDGTIVGLFQFITKHGLTLTDEYHGAIY